MSEKKILSINPSIFSFDKRSSRKKRPTNEENGKIKIKSNIPKKRTDTLKKKSILRMIRQHQENRYKNLFDEKKSTSINQEIQKPSLVIEELDKGFKDAQVFLQNLSEKKEKEDKMKNYTVKNYTVKNYNNNQVETFLTNINNNSRPVSNATQNIVESVLPQYGCLKNGSLPTYRNYMNKTRTNQPNIIIGGDKNGSQTSVNQHNVISNPLNLQPNSINVPQISPSNLSGNSQPLSNNENEIVEKKINESLKKISEMKQTASRLKQFQNKIKHVPKRKKTVRRTYKIGKSRVLPRISVLVSNKTIRNNITTKSQLLKQTPIQDVKRYLMKRGFLKVGSTAPNDVLRKMYEEAVLMCGEVQNHNPDNLLHNFLNDSEK